MKNNLESILQKEQIIFTDVLESNIDNEIKTRKINQSKTLIV
jgi:hypothetical protein